jgi:ABC-2 type transport system ATP-binding protein
MKNPGERIDQLMKAFEVEKYHNTMIDDLSAGNKTRLSLCKAFINSPQLVLLDEPTASLDPDIADKVRTFIKDARDKFKTTILITSHNMAEVEELCDRVIFIDHGKIVAEDTPEGLAKNIKKTRVEFMIKDGQKRTVEYCKKRKLQYKLKDRAISVEIAEEKIAQLLNDLAILKIKYSQISIDKPTLEDYFIEEVRHVR